MRKIITTIPFGWEVSIDCEGMMIPVPLEQEMLKKAKDYLESCSLREVADWLSRSTGRKISHMGLKYIKTNGWKAIEDLGDEEEIKFTRNVIDVNPSEEAAEEFSPADPLEFEHHALYKTNPEE